MAVEVKLTPRDSVDALRLMNKNKKALLEPGDGPEVKEQIQGVIATYLAQKRAGGTELEFLDWYENADLTSFAEEAADPTA